MSIQVCNVCGARDKTDSQVVQKWSVHCDIFAWKACILLRLDVRPSIGIVLCRICSSVSSSSLIPALYFAFAFALALLVLFLNLSDSLCRAPCCSLVILARSLLHWSLQARSLPSRVLVFLASRADSPPCAPCCSLLILARSLSRWSLQARSLPSRALLSLLFTRADSLPCAPCCSLLVLSRCLFKSIGSLFRCFLSSSCLLS